MRGKVAKALRAQAGFDPRGGKREKKKILGKVRITIADKAREYKRLKHLWCIADKKTKTKISSASLFFSKEGKGYAK